MQRVHHYLRTGDVPDRTLPYTLRNGCPTSFTRSGVRSTTLHIPHCPWHRNLRNGQHFSGWINTSIRSSRMTVIFYLRRIPHTLQIPFSDMFKPLATHTHTSQKFTSGFPADVIWETIPKTSSGVWTERAKKKFDAWSNGSSSSGLGASKQWKQADWTLEALRMLYWLTL